MQFNDYMFVFYFLPITVLLYFLANKIHLIAGKFVVIVASIIFYSFGRPEMLAYLGVSIGINYVSAVGIKRFKSSNKRLVAIPILINVALLFYFKYFNFAMTNLSEIFGGGYEFQDIILPLGISFYTFQQIAYVVSVTRGELDSVNFVDYLTYILYFPKLLMGPIIEPVDFIGQINQQERKAFCTKNLAIGIKIFSLGLLKKALIADTFAKAVSWVYTNLETASAMDCSLLVVFYTLEIYFDFSGYSDMAVGISSMLNIDLPMNFDSPYKAVSIRDFWKRWHISLTKFLTKYIYIPLGGSKKGAIRTYINMILVFLISGLWHGANWTFILWGAIHGLLNCFDRLFEFFEEKVFLPVRWICTLVWVSILWLLFSAESVEQWQSILQRIVFMQNMQISDGLINMFYLPEGTFLYQVLNLNYWAQNIRGFNMLLFILVAFIVCTLFENNFRKKEKLNFVSMLCASIAFVWGVLCLGAESTFVYFGF